MNQEDNFLQGCYANLAAEIFSKGTVNSMSLAEIKKNATLGEMPEQAVVFANTMFNLVESEKPKNALNAFMVGWRYCDNLLKLSNHLP